MNAVLLGKYLCGYKCNANLVSTSYDTVVRGGLEMQMNDARDRCKSSHS